MRRDEKVSTIARARANFPASPPGAGPTAAAWGLAAPGRLDRYTIRIAEGIGSRVVRQGALWRFQSLPKSSFRVRTRLRRQRSSIRARHPIAQGCRASPARSRPARMAIRRAIATASTSKHRPTWHLASSRCCAGNGPEFLATMAAVMKMSLRRARWLVLCRRACVALDALLKTPRLCPLVRVSVRTMRLLLIARGPRWGLMGAADL